MSVTYSEPQAVVVNQPTVLKGTYDPQSVSAVAVVAEDKFPLPVTLNATAKTWQVVLDKGFSTAGVRWVRIRGSNRNNQVVGEQVIYIAVTPLPMSAADSLTLKVTQTTWFKVAPIDSNRLTDRQKVQLSPGQTYGIKRYTPMQGHILVEMAAPIDEIGYIYQPHAQLSYKGERLYFEEDELPAPSAGTMLAWIRQDTKIKTKPEPSIRLNPIQQSDLLAGQVLPIVGYACLNNHFRITLSTPLQNLGKSGYLYFDHARIKQASRWIQYDRNAFTLTLLRNTPIKKRPIDSSQLAANEKLTLQSGGIYGISSYAVEGNHVRVSLTENLPGFGNTGYLFLDFIQVRQGGQPFNLFPTLRYTGPREVLVNRPTVLSGTFDSNRATAVTVVAEDKHSLPVTIDRNAGTWRVNLNQGFKVPGSRWLRLKSTGSNGAVVGNQIFYVTVSTDALTVGESLQLKVLQNTFLKVAPVDSGRLTSQQRIQLNAGQIIKVAKYGFSDGHLKIMLDYSIDPVGDFGYVFEPHVQLTKGSQVLRFGIEDVPNMPISGQMLVTETTFIKGKPEDAVNLPANQKAQLLLGQTYGLRGYAATRGHFRVTLTDSIPNFGNVGFVFRDNVQLRRNNKLVAYDPNSLTMTVQQETLLKRKPVQSSELASKDQTKLPTGRVYGLEGFKTESGHVLVTLTEDISGYGNTGYIYPGHIAVRRGSRQIDVFPKLPKYVELNVPYFSQRDNPRYYWSTCNVTAIAMIFYYYGVRPSYTDQLEDELLQWVFKNCGEDCQTDHTVLQQLIKAYGFKSTFSTTRKWSEVDWELASGRPVVLAGDFTATGHIVTAIGYTPEGLIVNDPWGDALTGYMDTEGPRLIYYNSYIDDVCGPDGNVWAHFISK
jgi:Peptidase_C39 like family